MECGNLETFYPNFEFMHFAIKNWSAKELPIWESLKDTFELEYNPIWNVDGFERETINSKSKDVGTVSTSSNGTNINQTAGFNSSQFQNKDKDTNESNSDVNSNDERNEDIVRNKERGGNIGVTMTQQMLEAELDVRPKLNIYNYIIQSFKSRFCVLIY